MITGGKVTFGRVVQPAQYETKRAEVEIFFSLPEGVGADAAQDELNKAADMAQAKALELVGLKKAEKAPEKPAEAAPEKPKAEKPKAEVPKATRTKADIEKEVVAAAGGTVELPKDPAPNISTNPEDRKDPAQVEDDPAAVGDDALFTADAAPVTDADLRNAITKKQEKIKNAVAIRGLIGKYVKPGQGAGDIAADKRQAFLVELEAL